MQTGTAIGPYLLGPQIDRVACVGVPGGAPARRHVVALKVLHPGIAGNGDRVQEFAFEVPRQQARPPPDHRDLRPRGDPRRGPGHRHARRLPGCREPWRAAPCCERGPPSWPAESCSMCSRPWPAPTPGAGPQGHQARQRAARRFDLLKLTDFGLVLSTQDPPSPGGRNTVSGTPAYMAPEQIRGEAHAFGPWTDLYAVGVMAWGLACGANPFGTPPPPSSPAPLRPAAPFQPAAPPASLPSGSRPW